MALLMIGQPVDERSVYVTFKDGTTLKCPLYVKAGGCFVGEPTAYVFRVQDGQQRASTVRVDVLPTGEPGCFREA